MNEKSVTFTMVHKLTMGNLPKSTFKMLTLPSFKTITLNLHAEGDYYHTSGRKTCAGTSDKNARKAR